MRPTVSVIVPVYNDAQPLRHLLVALGAQTFPADETEVLVVDNGSTQDIAAVVTQTLPRARLLHEATPGSYAARNRALQDARGDLLAFTDADCLPEPEWLERGVAALRKHKDAGLVAGRVAMFAHDSAHPTGPELWDMAYSLQQDKLLQDQKAVTANLFTRRSVIAAVGPFNAALKSRGDFEWSQRVAAAGLAQHYADDVVVRHPARRGLRDLGRRSKRIRGGMVATGETRPSLWRWFNNLLPPTHSIGQTRRYAKEFGWGRGVRFYGTTYYNRVVCTVEEIRLALRGKARR